MAPSAPPRKAARRRGLPTGTVTFLFTDLEGSTRLARELGPETYRDLLEQHHRLLRTAFSAHGGVERGTQGDAFLVVFTDAVAAVAAAVDSQRALAAASWPNGTEVRVRMGIHSGAGIAGGDDYVGLDINRAARIASAAHGGQVLISDATRALAERDLPSGVGVRDLGRHRLKDLAEPEHLFQLVHEELRADFPPLSSLSPIRGNLPLRLTSFVGRERELSELAHLLTSRRLVTLTGSGGSGKTSLAIELARAAGDRFSDGAWFVPLEAIADPELVSSAIVAVLGIVATGGRAPASVLRDYLRDRNLILVVDNFEHLLAASDLIGSLLADSPELSIVVTSRAALHLRGEQEYPVQPLAVPDQPSPDDGATSRAVDLAALEACDAVRLFLERASQARPGFALTAETATAVAETCRRLDGLPLAIELAAARAGLLAPTTIAERLAQHLPLPGGGPRDLPDRQRTIERTVAWSCDLLDAPTQRLFARVSVFAGGWDLEAAESVSGPADEAGVEALDGIADLVEQSLVRAATSGPTTRFTMLEPIREIAAASLARMPDADAVRRRHAEHYLRLAEAASAHMPGRSQVPWIARLTEERDNVRVAVADVIRRGDAAAGLAFASSLWRYWQLDGHVAEGIACIETVLSMPGADQPSLLRMRGLDALGGLLYWAADTARAAEVYREVLALAQTRGDRGGEADALANIASSIVQIGDVTGATGLIEHAEALYRELGDALGAARAGGLRAIALLFAGNPVQAQPLIADSAARLHALDDVFYEAVILDALGWVNFVLGDVRGSVPCWRDAMTLHRAMGNLASATFNLEFVAILAMEVGLPTETAIVHGAFEALCRRYAIRPPAILGELLGRKDYLARAEEALGSSGFAEAHELGSRLSLDEAVDRATAVARLVEEHAGP